MSRRTKWIVSLLLLVTLAVATFAIVSLATSDAPVNAMTDILSDNELNGYLVETHSLSTDGYLGIPVDLTVYYDYASYGKANPTTGGTTLIMYVVNTLTTRAGTDTDVSIIKSMIERGYIVVVTDYHNHKKTTPDDIEWSVNTLAQSVRAGKNFTHSSLPVGAYAETFVVPAGCDLSRDNVYWEIDKHSVDGTLEQIVKVWNADFRAYKGDVVIPWVYENGTRKPTQPSHELKNEASTDPVWYSVGTGAGAITYNGVSYVPDQENGTYVQVKHTKAVTVGDCVKPDGTPIDLNVYLHVVYPTNPEKSVPVMTLASSAEDLTSGAMTAGRPHLYGFAFEGYAVAMYDYVYVPMARDDHYGYFDGSSSTKSVTGDMMTYSLYTYNMALAPTAALRYIRYLAASDGATFNFNGEIGVIGNSKASNITQLADLDLQHIKTVADGFTEQQLLEYAQAYICSFPEHYYISGHHGETRYDVGYYTYVDHGLTVDGSELQPWLTYGGSMLNSGADFVYCSCGAITTFIDENYGPMYTCGHIDAETNGYGTNNQFINYARYYDLPLVWFEVSLGHTFVARENNEHDVDPYVALKDYANYVLNGEAPKVSYVTPLSGFEVSATPSFTIKFTGIVSSAEAQKIHLLAPDGTKIFGTYESAYGRTEWTFTPDVLAAGTKYTLVVPADLVAENGQALGTAYTATYYTEVGEITHLDLQNNAVVCVVVPSAAQYALAGANRAELRVYVSSDSHNILDAYILTSLEAGLGSVAASVNTCGAGYYTLDLTDALSAYTPGSTVYVMLKDRKAAGSTVLFVEDFEDGAHGFAVRGMAPTKIITDSGNKILEAYVGQRTGGSGHAYYASNEFLNDSDFILSKVTAADYGRRFTVSFRLRDTVARHLNVECFSLSSASTGVVDYDATNYNVSTDPEAGWVTCSFDVVIKDSDYGKAGVGGAKGFRILLKPSGNTNARIYLDDFTLTENFDASVVTSASLALINAGGSTYKAPINAQLPFAVGGVSYATLTEALANLGNATTVTLQSNVTLTDATVITKPVTLDLNGYQIRTDIADMSLVSIAQSGTVTLKNGSVFLSGGSLLGFENASSAINVTLLLENVHLGAEKRAMVNAILANTAAADSASVNASIVLNGCSVDMRYESYCKNPLTLLPASTANVSVTATVRGGSIIMTRMHKMRLAGDSSKLIFAADAQQTYPVFYYTAGRTLGDNVLVKSDDGFRFFVSDASKNVNGFNAFIPKTNEYCTPFGVIPEEYADENQYPFVIFNTDTNEFVGVSDLLIADGSGILSQVYHKSGNYGVYMRRDVTHNPGAALWNFGFVSARVVIDLGGHTLTHANGSNPLFLMQSKKTYTVDLTFRNGTIANATAQPLLVGRSEKVTENFNITFDAVTFKATGATKPATWILQSHSALTTTPYNVNVTVNNCTFDLTNVTSATTLFNVGDASGLMRANVTVSGGDLKGDLANVTFSAISGDNSSVAITRNTDGKYITNTRPMGTATPGMSFKLDNQFMVFNAEGETKEGYTTYSLGVNTLATPYGTISPQYSDAQVVVFDANGQCVAGGSTLSDAINFVAKKNATYYVYLRDNVVHSAANWDFGYTSGNLLFDLNGYTVTMSAHMFWAKARNSAAINVTIKNGTINVAGKNVLTIACQGGAGKVMNYTFENITFTNVSSNAWIVGEEEAGFDGTVTAHVTFTDCHFDIPTWYDNYFFRFSESSPAAVNIYVMGGYISRDKSEMPKITNFNTLSGKTVVYGQGTDGEYPYLVTHKSTVGSDGIAVSTTMGTRYFVKESDTDTSTIYRLGEKTKYGYLAPMYANAAEHPVLVFDANGALIGAYKNMTDPYVMLSGKKGTTYYIWMRADAVFNNGNVWNFASGNGNFIFDLDGHTLALTYSFLLMQAKSDAGKLSVTVKNGTIQTNNQWLVSLGAANAQTAGKVVDVLFDNVTIQGSNIIRDTSGNSAAITTSVVFNNCVIEAAATMFHLGYSSNVGVNVQFNGGALKWTPASGAMDLYMTQGMANKVVTFNKDASGSYPTFTFADGVDVSALALKDRNGESLGFAKLSADTYILSPFTFKSVYLNVTNDLNLVYRVRVPEGYSNLAMTFLIAGKTEVVTDYTVDNNGWYCFKLSEIGPHKMGEVVTATLTATIDGKTVTIVNDNTSVKSYAEGIAALYPNDQQLLTLVDALLAYGAASQQYVNYHTDNLVGTPVAGEIGSQENTLTMTGTATDVFYFKSCGVFVDDAFALRVSIAAEDFNGLTLVVKKGGKTATYDLSTLAAQNGVVTVYYDELTAKELGVDVTFTVEKNGVAVGKTLTFSANAYLYRMQNTENAALCALVKCLYAYGVAAERYTEK